MNIISKLEAEKARLESQIARETYDFEMANYPEGRLNIKQAGKYYKMYHVYSTPTGTKRTYIKKKNIDLAQCLAQKAYKKTSIQAHKKELQAINAYLRYYPRKSPDDYFRNSSEYKRLLEDFIPISEAYNDWACEEYERNPEYPERLIYPTMKGDMVRSKSEAMIADEFYRRGIPYRYEYKTTIGGYDVYPDFTIIDPVSGKTYIWEHFGKMDDDDYVNKCIWKLRLYLSNGYIPQVSLLTTYETGMDPLTSVRVVETIDQFF